jgi:hypothetical protein
VEHTLENTFFHGYAGMAFYSTVTLELTAVAVGVGGAVVSTTTVGAYDKIEWVLSHWDSSWSEWRVAGGELDDGRGQGAIAPALGDGGAG